MNTERHIPAVLNSDDDERFFTMSDALSIQNCRIGLSLNGKNLRIENIPSSALVPGAPVSANNTCIGSCIDSNRRRIIYACYNSTGQHAIYCYDIPSGNFYTVMTQSQFTAPAGLNFSLDNRLDRNMRVISDLLIWVEGTTDPRCINIESGIKSNHPSYVTDAIPYSVPIDYAETTVIKRPPLHRLRPVKLTDSSFVNNFIANQAFQFTWRYTYRDGQVSALAPYSDLVNFNNDLEVEDTYNFIRIWVPLPSNEDIITDDLMIVSLFAKFGNNGKTFVIKTWDRRNPADEAEIQAAITGTPLIYEFYNNTTGAALDDVSSVNNFDNVPLSAKTLEVAKNRIFLGNIVSGYDSPMQTSLSAAPHSSAGGTVATIWHDTRIRTGHMSGSSFVFVEEIYFVFVVIDGKYYNFGSPTTPTAINLSDATTITSTWQDMVDIFWTPGSNGQPIYDPSNPPADDTDIIPTPNVTVTINTSTTPYQYKANSYYKLGITFFDGYRRKSGIVTSESATVTIDERTFSTLPTANQIEWTLSNTNALAEIPKWARSYQINITKNQVFDFFVECGVGVGYIKYVKKNADGTFDFTGDTFDPITTYGLGFNLYNLTSFGMGYTYSEGDLLTAYSDDVAQTVYHLRVLAQSGGWVIATPVDIGSLAGTGGNQFVIDIYTPYSPSANEPFYEASESYEIINPGTQFAKYSILSDVINGDVYGSGFPILPIQSMSPSRAKWQDWERSLGWINIKDEIGQQDLKTTISFSDTFIEGSQVNGINKFQPLNTHSLTTETGPIQKLILTNKIAQELGSIMLCICQNEPLSIYLGETQLMSTQGDAFVAQSVGVIGTVNPLRGNYGTMHPESVIDYLGEVYWFDIQHGMWIRYSSNGADPVNYKMDRYFKKFKERYLVQKLDMRIISCIDPVRNHMMAVMPSTETVDYPYTIPSYNDVVPSYATTIKSQFDMYDGHGKMAMLSPVDNAWRYTIGISPEWLEFTENNVYGFVNGAMHQMESGVGFNTFLGQQLPSRLAFPMSQTENAVQIKNAIKDLFSLSIEGNMVPNYVLGYAQYPNEQVTDIASDDVGSDGRLSWQNINGIKYASFLRDRLSPNVNGSAIEKMNFGDYIRSVTPLIMIEFQAYDDLLSINGLNLNYEIVSGHKT